MKGLLSLKNLTPIQVLEIVTRAIEFKKGRVVDYRGMKGATLFYENSTRTQYSFTAAMLNLGITPVSIDVKTSSIQKGETLYDTCKTLECVGFDTVVIRHTIEEFYREKGGSPSLDGINIPLFNAGDGKNEHPTQTLLDLVTIFDEYKKFAGLSIAFIGDIRHSRVAHGNNDVFKRMGMKTFIAGPEEYLDDTTTKLTVDEAVKNCDICMFLRVQNERLSEGERKFEKGEYLHNYGLTPEREAMMKPNAIIMHPAPFNRGVEIDDKVIECGRSRIFPQIKNGVFTRMAVMDMALSEQGFAAK